MIQLKIEDKIYDTILYTGTVVPIKISTSYVGARKSFNSSIEFLDFVRVIKQESQNSSIFSLKIGYNNSLHRTVS